MRLLETPCHGLRCRVAASRVEPLATGSTCIEPMHPELTVPDVIHPPSVHGEQLGRDPARLR
jgi:hypothetical protein